MLFFGVALSQVVTDLAVTPLERMLGRPARPRRARRSGGEERAKGENLSEILRALCLFGGG